MKKMSYNSFKALVSTVIISVIVIGLTWLTSDYTMVELGCNRATAIMADGPIFMLAGYMPWICINHEWLEDLGSA